MNPYAWAARARRAWYERRPDTVRRLAMPVVSVGNLAVGGRGKTPTVRWLAAMLAARGERPAILTRGYARRRAADGVVVVSDGGGLRADLDRSGDEPLMLARSLPGVGVFVSPDRYLAGRLAERRFGATVHLLDDGFQHLAIAREVNLVIVSPADVRDGRTLPFGRLREPLSALRAADAVIVPENPARDDDEGEAGLAAVTAVHPGPVFRLRRALDAARPLWAGMPSRTDATRPREKGAGDAVLVPDPEVRVLAVAGIAEPQRFTGDLRRAGWTLAGELIFGDHEPFTGGAVERILRAVRDTGADLVLTTEKDLVRLLRHRPFTVPIAWVPLLVSLEPAETVREWISERIGRGERGRGTRNEG